MSASAQIFYAACETIRRLQFDGVGDARCDVAATIDNKKSQMTTPHNSPLQNHLLASLPKAEFDRLAEHLELVEMTVGDTLYESHGRLKYVYFPTTAVVSLLYVLESGDTAAIAVVGNEGVVGIALFMGGETTPNHAFVQLAGCGYRLKASFLNKEFNRAGPVLRILLRYTQALTTQMAQTAVCNKHHTLEQQFCRWLLITFDRLPSHDMMVTHEMISKMVGVRREGITNAVGKLKRDKLIGSGRGRIVMQDRPGLEKNVCECYDVVRKEYERLITDIPRRDPEHILGPSSG